MNLILECSSNHEYSETLALLSEAQGFMFTLQETRSIHDSMNIPKIEFITYIYILYYQSSVNFQLAPNLTGFSEILN